MIEKDLLPFEEGGFRPGAIVSQEELRFMLSQKNLAPGSLVRCKERRYRVSVTNKGVYFLERIRE